MTSAFATTTKTTSKLVQHALSRSTVSMAREAVSRRFSRSLMGSRLSSSSSLVRRSYSSIPQPALAVLHDYDDDDDYYHSDNNRNTEFLSGAQNSTPPRGPGGGSTSPYPPPSSSSSSIDGKQDSSNESQTTSRKSGGGSGGGGDGGSGRHRCPRCGHFVTFRHGDWVENSFYCAACSGWFRAEFDSSTTTPVMDERPIGGKPGGFEDLSDKRKKPPVNPLHSLPVQMHIPDNPNQYIGRPVSRRAEVQQEEEQAQGGPAQKPVQFKRIPTPREITAGLDEYVIGQSNVKIALAVGVYNHYKRIMVSDAQAAAKQRKEAAEAMSATMPFGPQSSLVDMSLGQYGSAKVEGVGQELPSGEKRKSSGDQPDINSIAGNDFGRDVDDVEIDKSNIMLLGPTGSGKTLLVKTLARLIDVPIVIADATCLTQAGYVGEDVESILFKLYLESGQDIERCQRGIVYIDEADKIRTSGGNVSISRDVSGEGVQHALLKIVEGNVINVPKEPGRKNPRGDFLHIDTTNILFICGGAFSGLERIINRRMDAASIGFGAQMKKAIDDPNVQGRYFDNAIPKDLVAYGMIPEFVGRFPVIVSTKGLDISNLVDILTVPKNSIMKQYRRLFAMDDVNFHVTADALEEMAKTAFSRGTGARGLRSITDNVLMETQYVVPSMPDVHTVYVDAAAVRGERKPVLLKDPDMTVEKYEALLQQGELNVEGAVSVKVDADAEVEEAVA